MKIPLALLLASLCLIANAADPDKIYVGKVSEISKDSLFLDMVSSSVSIGFVGTADALRSLRKMKVGQEVRAAFGSARAADGQLINKLVVIRVCRHRDKECAAARKKSRADDAAHKKLYALHQEKSRLCRLAMDETLATDPRYIPRNDAPVPEGYHSRFNSLSGDYKTCAKNVLDEYADAFDQACERHHCGDNVGGGCAHLTGYSLHPWVFEHAYAKCTMRGETTLRLSPTR